MISVGSLSSRMRSNGLLPESLPLDRRDVIAGTAGPERVASATSGPVYRSVSSLVSGMFMRMMIRRTMTTMIMINSS
jgi:hypothetical protein